VPVEIAGIVNALTSDLVPHKHAWLISGQDTTLAALCVVQSVSVLRGSVNSSTSWPRQQPYAANWYTQAHLWYRPLSRSRSSFNDVALRECQHCRVSRPYRDAQDRLLCSGLVCSALDCAALLCSGETRLALHVPSSS